MLDGNYTTILRAVFNKSWKLHTLWEQLYGHLPPISQTIQVRWRHIRIYQPLCMVRIWFKVNFWADFNMFQFGVFFLLDWLSNSVRPNYLSIARGTITGFMLFQNGISAMWNAISLVQDMNLCRRVHFLLR